MSALQLVRTYLDEPVQDAKYDNAMIVNDFLMPALVNVLSRLNNSRDDPILLRHSVSLVVDQQYYQLPPNIGEVWRLAILGDDGVINQDWRPRGETGPRGPGWAIEGNTLSVRPYPVRAEDMDIWYIPSGDFLPHYSTTTTGGTLDATQLIMTLSATPEYGQLDTRVNSYSGAFLRAWSTGGIIEERIISSYDETERKATVRQAFSSVATGSNIKYEIVAQGSVSLIQAVALDAAIELAAVKAVSEKKMNFLRQSYRKAMKTIGDKVAHIDMRRPKRFDQDTIDNQTGVRDMFFY
jgi:hypothetical protein